MPPKPTKSTKPTKAAASGRVYETVDLNPPKSALEKLVEAASASRLGSSGNPIDLQLKEKNSLIPITEQVLQPKKSRHDLVPKASKSIRSGTGHPSNTPGEARPTSTPLLDSFRGTHPATEVTRPSGGRTGSPGSGFIPGPGRASTPVQNGNQNAGKGLVGSSSKPSLRSASNPTIVLAPALPDLDTVLHHIRPSALPSSYPSGNSSSTSASNTNAPSPGRPPTPTTHPTPSSGDDANSHLQPVLVKRPGMKPRDHPVHLTFTSSTKSGPVGSRSDVGDDEEEDEGEGDEGEGDEGEGDEEHVADEEHGHDKEDEKKVYPPSWKQINGDSTYKTAGSANDSSHSRPARPDISIVKTSHPPFTSKGNGDSPSSPMSKRSSTSKTGKTKLPSSKGRSSTPTIANTGSQGTANSNSTSTSGLYVVKAPPPRPEVEMFKVKRRGGGGGGSSNAGMNPMTMMLLTGGMQQQQQQQQQADNNQNSNC